MRFSSASTLIAATSLLILAGPGLTRAKDDIGAVEYRLAGLSAAVLSDVGVNGMHAACQAARGPAARMCTSVEAVRSPELVALGAQDFAGRVQPVIVTERHDLVEVSGSSLFVHEIRDASGFLYQNAGPDLPFAPSIDCDQWTTQDEAEVGVFLACADGRCQLFAGACGSDSFPIELPVLCCTPRGTQ